MKNLSTIFLLLIHLSCQSQQNEWCWQKFQDSLSSLERDSSYTAAMEFLQGNKKNFVSKWFELSKDEIFLNEKLGKYEQNITIYNLAHQKGFFYFIHPNLPKYKPYVDLSYFSEISKKDMELRDIANSKSEMVYDIIYPQNYNKQKKYPAIFILHGGGSNLEKVKQHWYCEQLENQFIKIYVQNYLHYDTNNFGWHSGDEEAFKKIKILYAEIKRSHFLDEKKLIISGMSAGGTFAIDIAVRQIIPVSGFITFCPGVPQILRPEHYNEVISPDIVGFMLGGENDYYLEGQKQMMTVFNNLQIPCQHFIVENMGHEYPVDESKWITKALNSFHL